MKLSFGMMFSIFLIIVFLAFAVYAIIKFVNLQQTIQIEIFKKDLQADIDSMWQSQQGSREKKYDLPKNIDAICFTDYEYQNLILVSEDLIDGDIIEHINIVNITSSGDYCIPNIEGKVSMTLIKDYGETKIRITR